MRFNPVSEKGKQNILKNNHTVQCKMGIISLKIMDKYIYIVILSSSDGENFSYRSDLEIWG